MEYDSLSRYLGGEMVDMRDSKSHAKDRYQYIYIYIYIYVYKILINHNHKSKWKYFD